MFIKKDNYNRKDIIYLESLANTLVLWRCHKCPTWNDLSKHIIRDCISKYITLTDNLRYQIPEFRSLRLPFSTCIGVFIWRLKSGDHFPRYLNLERIRGLLPHSLQTHGFFDIKPMSFTNFSTRVTSSHH